MVGTEPSSLIPAQPPEGQVLRFGPFEMNLDTGELLREGSRVRLQLQPFKVLAVLALNPGRLVHREELQREVWPEGTFVDFEQSLNFCIRQVRSALGDQADAPRYVETLPRRGYRFIAPVERVSGPPEPPGAAPDAEPALVIPDENGGTSRASWPRLVPWALAAGLAAALALRPAPAVEAPRAPVFQRVTFQRGALASARFGAGGEIVYAAAWGGGPPRLWLSQPDQRETRPLEVEGSSVVGVTPSGELVWLRRKGWRREHLLLRAPLLGGPEKPLLDDVVEAASMPEGREFAVARRRDGQIHLEFPAGQPVATATWASSLRVSPDGAWLAYFEHPVPGDDAGSLVVVDRARQRRVLSPGWGTAQGLAWSPRGDEVWFTAAHSGADSGLHAADLEGRVRDLVPALGRLVLHDVSADGRLLLERNTSRVELLLGQAGQPDRDLSWLDASRVQDLSADGRLVLFGEGGEGAGPEYAVFLRPSDAGVPIRLGSGLPLGLSPDGSWAAAAPADRSRIDILPVGAGQVRHIAEPGLGFYDWADGLPGQEAIVFTARAHADASPRVYVRDLASGPARPVTPEGVGVWRNTLSPDGKWLVAPCPGEPTRVCRYGLSPDAPAPRPLASIASRHALLSWTPDGQSLLYRELGDPSAAELRMLDLRSGTSRPWRSVQPEDATGVVAVAAVVATPDGRSWACSVARRMSDLYVASHVR